MIVALGFSFVFVVFAVFVVFVVFVAFADFVVFAFGTTFTGSSGSADGRGVLEDSQVFQALVGGKMDQNMYQHGPFMALQFCPEVLVPSAGSS